MVRTIKDIQKEHRQLANRSAQQAFGRDANQAELDFFSRYQITGIKDGYEYIKAFNDDPNFRPGTAHKYTDTWYEDLITGKIKGKEAGAVMPEASQPQPAAQLATQAQPPGYVPQPIQGAVPPGWADNPSFFAQGEGFPPAQAGPAPAPLPAPVAQGLQTYYQTEYQPAVSKTGDVAAYVPPGMAPQPIDISTLRFPDTSNIPMSEEFLPPVTLAAGVPGVEPLTFDFPAEQRQAYDALKSFYDKLLSFSGGRLDLAKRILEYTYQQGNRESRQEYEQATREQAILFPQEREEKLTEQNRRGVMASGFGRTERGRLAESQNLRREAVQRALENRESRLGAQRGFGLEEKQRGFEEERFGLERERRQEASGMAEKKFGVKESIFQAQLREAERKEQERIRKEEQEFMKNIYRQQGYTV